MCRVIWGFVADTLPGVVAVVVVCESLGWLLSVGAKYVWYAAVVVVGVVCVPLVCTAGVA